MYVPGYEFAVLTDLCAIGSHDLLISYSWEWVLIFNSHDVVIIST